jgi:hypothetical protein
VQETPPENEQKATPAGSLRRFRAERQPMGHSTVI